MPTIRLRDWTKSRLDDIREEEAHSSHDSVIKSLLKDRELASSLGELGAAQEAGLEADRSQKPRRDSAVPGLTVLSELTDPERGVIFLWCPNCCTEVAHFTMVEPTAFEDFEIECQRCLTHLDHHAVVAIELSYPLELKLVEDELAEDLKAAVIDYWDHRLRELARDPTQADPEEVDRLVWEFDQYARDFMWEWPVELPVVSLEPGAVYEFEDSEERLEVVERVTETGTRIDAFRVKRYAGQEPPSDVEPEVLDSDAASRLLRNRNLRRVETV